MLNETGEEADEPVGSAPTARSGRLRSMLESPKGRVDLTSTRAAMLASPSIPLELNACQHSQASHAKQSGVPDRQSPERSTAPTRTTRPSLRQPPFPRLCKSLRLLLRRLFGAVAPASPKVTGLGAKTCSAARPPATPLIAARLGDKVPPGLRDQLKRFVMRPGKVDQLKRLIERCRAYDDGNSALSEALRLWNNKWKKGVHPAVLERSLREAIAAWAPPSSAVRPGKEAPTMVVAAGGPAQPGATEIASQGAGPLPLLLPLPCGLGAPDLFRDPPALVTSMNWLHGWCLMQNNEEENEAEIAMVCRVIEEARRTKTLVGWPLGYEVACWHKPQGGGYPFQVLVGASRGMKDAFGSERNQVLKQIVNECHHMPDEMSPGGFRQYCSYYRPIMTKPKRFQPVA